MVPLGFGCMRLSTARERDEGRARAVIRAALEAGARLLDTADVYGLGEGDLHHNERLIAEVLADWPGDRGDIIVATKGGLTRPGGRWVPRGTRAHLLSAAEASREALGGAPLDLYLLHAVDPKTPLATSARALRDIREGGIARAVGVCNVNLAQLDEVLAITDIDAVQVALHALDIDAIRGGVAGRCGERGIRLIAHSPLAGPRRARKLGRHPALVAIAGRRGVTPHQIALAWLRDLPLDLVPIPGATRVATARGAIAGQRLALEPGDRAELDAALAAGPLLRTPRAARRPRPDPERDVVLVMGIPGAGKSRLAAELEAAGYERLNRDRRGGTLADLDAELGRRLADGARRVVLDNTYPGRAERNRVVETAWAAGAPVRCIFLDTPIEEAQINVARRVLRRAGRLLHPDEIKKQNRRDPAVLGPQVLHRVARALEPPSPDEGFESIEVRPFRREVPETHTEKALIIELDPVLRRSRSGKPRPLGPEDVEVPPGRAEALAELALGGWRILGIAWQPELASGELSPDDAEAAFARTRELLGGALDDLVWCPHPPGPAACWCRKPLPGLGVALIDRHRLDPGRCRLVGPSAADRQLAGRLGIEHAEPDAVFSPP